MNLYFTAFAIRRVLAIGLTAVAALVGHHVVTNAQEDTVNHAIDDANRTVQKSVDASRAPQPKANGTYEINSGAAKVTVKGLPTAD